ncbi:MAG: CT253 family lipoprotein [Parachlamydiales bacterium]|jgi:hypothetical protein
MRYLISAFFVLIACVSCSNDTANQQVSRFYDDGRSRANVSVSSVMDSTSYDVPWSLSEEFTQLIKNNLASNKNFYLSSAEAVDSSLTNSDNPFDININWMKDRFENSEFLVFLELIKHDEEKNDNATNLEMTMRIRVVDVRAKEPKIILQECIDDNYYIAKGAIKTDYQNTVWGTDEYVNSRMGMAHNQLANDVAKRISEYIALAKSR